MSLETDRIISACHRRLRSGEFHPATEADLDRRGPCSFCFPEGNIDLPLEDLCVATKHMSKIHRRLGTGGVEYRPRGTSKTSLANKLEHADPDAIP